jgi:hypothetical protein
MVKKSFTLIEAIVVILIISLLSIGVFNIIKNIYVRNFLAVNTSKLEFKSQQLVDELALLLYYRIPLSVIGYNQETGDYEYIGFIEEGENYPILEWIGYANDAMVDRNLSGFIDMYASDSESKTLKCLDFNKTFIEDVLQNKFNSSDSLENLAAIIFAGTFDRGEESALVDYNNSFGWHGGEHKVVFIIDEILYESGLGRCSDDIFSSPTRGFLLGTRYDLPTRGGDRQAGSSGSTSSGFAIGARNRIRTGQAGDRKSAAYAKQRPSHAQCTFSQ